MSMIVDIGVYLAAAGHGIVGQSIFFGEAPVDAPDLQTITLMDRAGRRPTLEHDSVLAMKRPSLQVVVGDPDPEVGRTRAHAVMDSLVAIQNQTLSSTYYYKVDALHSPAPVGKDDRRRYLFSTNFMIDHEV